MDRKALIATRRNPILQARVDQLAINQLAYNGGAPYIGARLCRYPSESLIDFAGGLSNAIYPALGRKDRAFVINYARRIAHKINQYVFQADVDRAGIDEAFRLDATATGLPINQLMADLSTMITVGRWAWIGIDRPATPAGRSVASRTASGDRIYWQLYDPTEVVDWSFSTSGRLNWAITERTVMDDADPTRACIATKVRYLHQPRLITRYTLTPDSNDFVAQEDIPTGLDEVNLVCCGMPSSQPWWMDEVEGIQRAIMDLLSSRDTQIFKSVFSTLIVSDSFATAVRVAGLDADTTRAEVNTGHIVTESPDDKGTTRYLAPSTDVFSIISDAKKDYETSLLEIVGLAMSTPDSKQVSSAESKAWDHLDVATVLKERASMLEETETKCVELSAKLGGPVWTPYTPTYAKTFSVTDFSADISAITEAASMSLPPMAERLLKKVAVKAIGKRFNISEDDVAGALEDIDQDDPSAQLAAISSRPRGGNTAGDGYTQPPANQAALGGEDGP